MMKILISKNNIIYSLLLILLYILLIINYRFVISEEFGYTGFLFSGFSVNKLFIISIYTLVLIVILNFITDSFYSLIYCITLILFYFGQSIYFLFNYSVFALVLIMSLPSIVIFILDKITPKVEIKRKIINLNNKYERLFLIAIILLLILPFFQNIGTLNLKNLLLIDIYDTRTKIKEQDIGILGYLISPLSRVVLPFLLIYSYIKRNKFLFTITITSVILLFLLSGAVKSIFIGIFCALFFISGDYKRKCKNFIITLLLTNILAITTFVLFNSVIINDYIRRILYVPANLFQVYYEYYNNNYTYFKHTRLYSLIYNVEKEKSVSMFIGEYILGKEGLNANVGIFVEGFFSLGIIGVLISVVIFALFIFYIRVLNLNHSFFGMIFVYIYIINTSFIETLILTHGLLFLVIFSYWFIPSNKMLNCKYKGVL